MLEAISILLALLIGFLLVRDFDPVRNMQPRWAAILFDAALGAGIGMGLTSIVFLFLDLAGAATPAAIFAIDIVLVSGLAWRFFRSRAGSGARTSAGEAAPGFRWTWLLAVAFGIVLVMSSGRLVQMAAAAPAGEWDAWTLWNLRAKFLAGPNGAWRYALSPLLYGTHPDYPLLLPAFVARAWKAGGSVDAIAPLVTAFAFFASLLALLVSAVALLRGAASALLAGLVTLSTTSLLIWAPAQYADIPLAFFYLASLALIFLEAAPAATGLDPSSSAGRRWALPWAGLCVGLAAWTKDEGVAYLVCILMVFFAFTLWRLGAQAAFIRSGLLLAGAAPGVLLTLWLKFFLVSTPDSLVSVSGSSLAHLTDLSRYLALAKGLWTNLLDLGSGVAHPLILLAILGILLRWKIEERYRVPALIATASLVLVFLSYCGVLLITPYGLAWQVSTSFDRLILQVWPGFLLVFFVMLRRVADTAPLPAPGKTAATRNSPAVSGKRTPGRKLKQA